MGGVGVGRWLSGWVGGVGIYPAAVQRATKRTAAGCVPRGGLLTVCPSALAHAGHATPSAAAKQRRYAISVEHAAFMEDIEVEDAASGLEASPLAATMLPPWMRAVQRVQEEFDMLNERECDALRCAMVCCAALREKCCAAAAGRRGWHEERARRSEGAVGVRPARRGLRRTSGAGPAADAGRAPRAAPPPHAAEQMWREEEASIAAIERFEREIREQVEQNREWRRAGASGWG